jgi:Flp pilus assembly protein TadB
VSRAATSVVVGLLLAAALVAAARSWWRPPVPLAVLRERLSRPAPPVGATPSRRPGLVGRMANRLAAGDSGARVAARYALELRAAGVTVPDLLARCLGGALLAFAGIAGAGAAAGSAIGLAPGAIALAALLAGCAGAIVPVLHLRAEAARARRAFRHAVADVIELVAVCLTSGRSVEEAVRYATEVGEGPAFTELRSAVVHAPLVGRTVWEALDAVAAVWGVPELATFAASVERAAVVGASVAETVATQAQAMRQRALDDLERDADGANLRMLAPTYVFVAGFIAFLLYPLLSRISSAGP